MSSLITYVHKCQQRTSVDSHAKYSFSRIVFTFCSHFLCPLSSTSKQESREWKFPGDFPLDFSQHWDWWFSRAMSELWRQTTRKNRITRRTETQNEVASIQISIQRGWNSFCWQIYLTLLILRQAIFILSANSRRNTRHSIQWQRAAGSDCDWILLIQNQGFFRTVSNSLVFAGGNVGYIEDSYLFMILFTCTCMLTFLCL